MKLNKIENLKNILRAREIISYLERNLDIHMKIELHSYTLKSYVLPSDKSIDRIQYSVAFWNGHSLENIKDYYINEFGYKEKK